MKKFLFSAAMAALLAMPGISMAGMGMGAGVVPSMTLQANSMHYSMTNRTTVMTRQNFYYRSGALSFTMNNADPADKTSGSIFKGQMAFTGSASVGQTTIGNVFMNFSGLMLNASKTMSAAIGYGTVTGKMNVTRPGSFGNMSTFTPSFTGAYKLQAALGGWTNGQPTYGTAVMNVMLSGVNMPDANNNTITPEPVVVYMTLPAVPFKVFAGSGVGNGTYDVTGSWNGMQVKSDMTEDGQMSINMTQTGNVITGTITSMGGSQKLTGMVSGSTITMQYSGSSGNMVTITGTLNPDHTMSGAYNDTASGTGKWGMALSTSSPVGVTGSWTMDHTSTMGMDSGMGSGMGSGMDTLNITQYGGTVLGTESNYGKAIMGTVSGTTVTMSFPDSSGGTVKTAGALSGTMTGGAYQSGSMMKNGTYTDMMGGTTVDKGTWTATMN